MQGRIVLALCVLSAGCPGQRRPDPRWSSAARSRPEEPAALRPVAPEPAPGDLAGLRARVVELDAKQRAAPADRAAWTALIEAIGRAENAAQEMSERDGPESDAGYDALEELGRLRSEVVLREPR